MSLSRRAAPAGRLRLRASRAVTFVAALTAGALAVFGGAGAAAATSVTTNVPFNFTYENPCFFPAETFIATGKLHLLVSGNISESGMTASHLEANLQGVQGATPLTGKKYVVVDTQSISLGFDSNDLEPFRTTMTWMVQFVRAREDGSPVGGDDFYQHIVAHATVNANGTVTVDRFTFETRCR